jgi:hypothetical protein
MRHALLTVLLVIAVCFSVWAAGLFSKKTPTIDPKFQTALKSLVPTEAEAKAIAHLRAKTGSQRFETDKSGPPVCEWIFPNEADVPADAEPVANPEDVNIALECRYIIVDESLAKKVIAEPAMNWSMLPPQSNLPSTKNFPVGTSSYSVHTEVPIQVRFLEESNYEKLWFLCQSERSNACIEGPKIMLHCGQPGMINDTTIFPFVTGVVPVEADGVVAYQPIMQLTQNGVTIKCQATVLQDGSCRLDTCLLEKSNILKTEMYQLMEEVTETKGKISTKSGITVQVPTVQSFRVTLPEVVIPAGMSLLVAFPGIPAFEFQTPPYRESNEPRAMFMLITARAVRGMGLTGTLSNLD